MGTTNPSPIPEAPAARARRSRVPVAPVVTAPPAGHPVGCMCIDCVASRESAELVIYQADSAATAGILIEGHPNNCVCVDCAAAANAGISLQR